LPDLPFLTRKESMMKKMMIAAIAVSAVTLGMGVGNAFAQASGAMGNDAMSHDTMSKGAMSHDEMSKGGAMSHDQMAKDGSTKKHDAMGMDHPASGAMSQ
jgi:pentapeptide MXKDX repeat protein